MAQPALALSYDPGEYPIVPSYTAPQSQATALSGNIGSMPAIGNIASGINAINLGYQAGAIPQYNTLTGNVSSQAAALLDPNNAQANYDVSMHGAENAVGRGIAGSGAAAETTGRMRQADIERRAMLGNELLTSQVQRLPRPFDAASQLLNPGQVSAQDSALLSHLISRGAGGGGGGGTPGLSYTNLAGARGGGRYGPAEDPYAYTASPGDAAPVIAYGTPSLPTLTPQSLPFEYPPNPNRDPALHPVMSPSEPDYFSEWGLQAPPTEQAPLAASAPQLGSNYFSDWDLANPVPADYGWLD